MSKPFQWDQFPSFSQESTDQESTSDLDWDKFPSFPSYEAEKENAELESSLKSGIRRGAQIPKGLLNLNPIAATLNTVGALSTLEGLSGLENEFSTDNIARLRQLFPQAPWEEFDRAGGQEAFKEKYLEGINQASKVLPTVENLSRRVEEATGLPLESKTLTDELIQLGSGIGTGLISKLSTTPSKFTPTLTSLTKKGINKEALPQQLAKKFTQGEIIAEGRRVGLTDAEIAPLLNSERKLRFLSKVANKGSRPQRVLARTKDKIGNAYDVLKESELASEAFNPTLQQSTLVNLTNSIRKLPDVARQGIIRDSEILLEEPALNVKNLIEYRQKIQQTMNSNPEKYKTLSTLKNTVDEAILDSNPLLAREYNGLNRLYEQYSKISSALKPNLVDKFVSKGEALATLYGILTLDVPLLAKIGGEMATRRLSTEALVNPRFQQLSSKLVNAVNQNKHALAAKITQSMASELRPYSEEIADEIEEIDWENF